ncbi:MAG: YeeE/YedE thiosulfate transporter family protein [Gemmatimonadota bacterium]
MTGQLPYLGEGASLFFALLLGIGFGWFLERGGMGSARRLAAVFYGKDMAVFKLMFSAIVTAMLGAFWLSRLGVLDLTRVWLPPTYIAPQAVGGLVFGVGFVTGGLCPGTGCVAASSGRKDGFALIAGMILGVFLFDETFPIVAGFYDSTGIGPATLASVTGLPTGTVVLVVTIIALAGFAMAERIERSRRQ